MNRITPEISRREEPQHKEGVLWVECLKGNESQKFEVYSPAIMGCEMHWMPNIRRTVPCFENHDLCPGGHSEKTLKWRAYVHAYSLKRKRQVFVQLTWDAWCSWKSQLPDGKILRGSLIQVHRTNADNGRLWVEVESWRTEGKKPLPFAMDCKASLFAMWKFNPSEIEASARLAPGRDLGKNGVISS